VIGILLAGGNATRLPNKPLLPQWDCRPVCFSGMDYLIRHKVDSITVVVPPESVIVDIIDQAYRGHSIQYVYQPEARGVGHALNCVGDNLGGIDDLFPALIVMGDNIYPRDEELPLTGSLEDGPFVVLRDVPAWRVPHLVRVGPNDRLTRVGPGGLVLSTPWFVTPGNFSSDEGWPDLQGVNRITRPGAGWWDIGTRDTYAAYWRQSGS